MLVTAVGWLGVVLCTMAYLLLTTRKIKAENILFQLFNIIGGLCLVTTAVFSNDIPNVVANLLWMFIGLYAIGRQVKINRRAQ